LSDPTQVPFPIAASAYLAGLQQQYPFLDKLENLSNRSPFAALQQSYDQLAAMDVSGDIGKSEQQLIESKARFAFFWSIAEYQQTGSYAERGGWLTRFSELSIDVALQCAWYHVGLKQPAVAKALSANGGRMPGLFIFGMGKLGGADLNFSSDVDLVAYFDPQVLPIPEMLGKSYICHKVLQKLTQMLSQNGRLNFVWRVDWRLRPNASATTLAMSTVAAADYYYFRASPWHRLALMKARIIAGDKEAGQLFLNSITPFIWRQNLDYRALDELAEIKNKINLEHPALRVERQWREPISDEVGGYNVKLGSGGIREIEFIANALQLVWGGRHYSLRTPNTLNALQALAELGQLETALAASLITAYKALRRIENGIQIMANQHTHLIPSEDHSQEKLLELLSVDSWADFTRELNNHRRIVSEQFEALFAEQASQAAEPANWPEELSPAAAEIVEAWDNGFYQYGVSNEVRHRLKPLAKALSEYLENAILDNPSYDSNATVLRVHEFFRSLPLGEQYFRLLAESPMLLESIIPPLLYSPAMTTLLEQSPHIIDCYMGNIGLSLEKGFDSEYVVQADQYEIRLERLRRFVNENLYQLYLLFLQGQLQVAEFQLTLSKLAQHTLDLTIKIVSDNMGLSSSPITVLGMGKVALRKMSPLSDLDLIFIYDPEKADLELASKFVSRLQTAISTPMREGVVYELDTRLRPSGRSGAPTVSIDSFSTHQLQRAHSWEHIALVPSRVVAGDRGMESRIDDIKRKVLYTPRDPAQLIQDGAKMWGRVSEHRLKDMDTDVMFSKLRPGGLMQSEYLAACLILDRAQEGGSDVDFDTILRSVIAGTELENLPDILQFWRIQQLWERLLGFTEQPLDNLPAVYLQRLLDHSGVSTKQELLLKKQHYSAQIIKASQTFFGDYFESGQKMDEWQETKVSWKGSGANSHE